jgi:hypothetical protein
MYKLKSKTKSAIEITKCNKTIFKILQKQCYNCLLNKYSICLITGLLFILIVLIVINLNEIFESKDHVILFNNEENSEEIDAVYTWVNGSELSHLKELKKFKENLKNLTTNINSSTLVYQKVEFKNYYLEIKQNFKENESLNKLKQNNYNCYYKLCQLTPIIDQNLVHYLLVVEPKLNSSDQNELVKEFINVLDKNLAFIMIQSELITKNVSLIMLNLELNDTNYYQFLIKMSQSFNNLFKKNDYKIYIGSYTTDDCADNDTTSNCLSNDKIYLIKQSDADLNTIIDNRYKAEMDILVQSLYKNVTITKTIPKQINEVPISLVNNIDFRLDIDYIAHDSSQTFTSDSISKSQEKSNSVRDEKQVTTEKITIIKFKVQIDMNSLNETKSKFKKLSITWDLGNPLSNDLELNRFYDNNELKYSLRSLEKYAPWFRNIYIVTNGQVPDWLNLTNSRVKLVKHEEIFPNKSHLPTFNSAAIETHLHRIKGLSKNFVYFNDDLLLTKPIWPDDFYTKSNGFKVYLAWSLPSCNNNKCPNNWIHDGFCDKACNTTDCEYDGGDCLISSNKTGSMYQQHNNIQTDLFCAPGCTTGWLADRYCDTICNNPKCGYDMGDCGVENFKNLFEIKLVEENELSLKSVNEIEIKIPTKASVFYINYSIAENSNLTSYSVKNATYTKSDMVRVMAVMNKFHILTVLLIRNASTDNGSIVDEKFKIFLSLVLNRTNEKEKVFDFIFNVNPNGGEIESTTTVSPSIKNSTVATVLFESKYDEILEKIPIENLKPKVLSIEVGSSGNNNNHEFNNKIIGKIFQNYKEYLNWSLANNYLSEIGYKYKIKTFIEKFKNETYILKDNEIDYEFVEDILFNKFDLEVYLNEYFKSTNQTDIFRKRKLLDTFADSLTYVNRLYNRYFGYLVRKVPAHMPHFIDRDAMKILQAKFPYEFDLTSSNKIRSRNDMQFAFSYYYYIISELENKLDEDLQKFLSNLFKEYDLNRDLSLNSNEIYLLRLRYDMSATNDSEIMIKNCSMNSQLITRDEFLNCSKFTELIVKKYYSLNKNSTKKYKYELLDDSQVYFQMVSGNSEDDVKKFETKLKQILINPKKFLCLNDNINYKLVNEAKKLKDLLENFYMTLFPLKSQFEKIDEINPNEIASDDLTNFIFLPSLFLFSIFLIYLIICNCFGYNIDIKRRRLRKREWRLKFEQKREFIKTSNDSSSIESDVENSKARKSSSRQSFIL